MISIEQIMNNYRRPGLVDVGCGGASGGVVVAVDVVVGCGGGGGGG